MSFDPTAAARPGSGVFGLTATPDEAAFVLVPVPFEATVSYGGGTARGPDAILAASRQVDLFDLDTGRPYEAGIAMLPVPEEVRSWSEQARALAAPVIAAGGVEAEPQLACTAAEVDALCERMNAWVEGTVERWLERGKRVGVVGGDHSVSFGAIAAHLRRYPRLGLLHLDAHADLRRAYEGFRWSHASILWNVREHCPALGSVVGVGYRDLCEPEHAILEGDPRFHAHYDSVLRRRLLSGATWASLAAEIVFHLPEQVYVTFDVDGLDPVLCPSTGTPVPGGLSFAEAVELLRAVVDSGRTLVGFDLVEVAPDPAGRSDWDANVGARLLYKLLGFSARTLAR